MSKDIAGCIVDLLDTEQQNHRKHRMREQIDLYSNDDGLTKEEKLDALYFALLMRPRRTKLSQFIDDYRPCSADVQVCRLILTDHTQVHAVTYEDRPTFTHVHIHKDDEYIVKFMQEYGYTVSFNMDGVTIFWPLPKNKLN